MNSTFFTYKKEGLSCTPSPQATRSLFKILTLLLLLAFSADFAIAQKTSITPTASGGSPCSGNVTPRPIIGEKFPCPGTIIQYCIDDDRSYLSFEWDVPRAFAGQPPTGWEIISGQGTRCVTVLVGTKGGTMKCVVIDPVCGNKTATKPVKPSNAFKVDITGPDSVCAETPQTFTALISDSIPNHGNGNMNGHGQTKGTFTYTWTIPAGWTFVSGQGTEQIVVIPDGSEGNVCVTINYTPGQGNGNFPPGNPNNPHGPNHPGLGGHNRSYCNTAASDCVPMFYATDCPITPLPVELIAFEAAMAQSQVLLKWSTAQEKDNKEFVIERSKDGRLFEAVGSVAGNGTTSQTMNYSFTDAKPLANTSYYRLKQVDFSGKTEFSPVRSVNNSGSGLAASSSVSAIPNPTTGKVLIQFASKVEDNGLVRLATSSGQVIWNGTVRQLAAQNNIIDMSRYNAGVYILIVNSESQNLSLRIIKL